MSRRKGYVEDEEYDDIDEKIIKKGNKYIDKSVKKRSVITFFILMSILALIAYEVYEFTMYTIGKRDENKIYNFASNIIENFYAKYYETKEDYTLKLLALGDIYGTGSLINASKTGSTYDFISSYTHDKELFSSYDAIVASFDTPVTGKSPYSTSEAFNAPTEFLDCFKNLGINYYACATYNMMDKNIDGVAKTEEKLKQAEVNYTGINKADPIIIEKNNIKIGVISYTTKCYINVDASYGSYINFYDEARIKEDIAYLNENKTDFIIAYLSMNQDENLVTIKQKNYVETLWSLGVDVVLGTGNNIIESAVSDMYEFENGSSKQVYAIYSLGEFVGSFSNEDAHSSLGANITFNKTVVKDNSNNIIEIKGSKSMTIEDPVAFYTKVDSVYNTINYPIKSIMTAYEEDSSILSTKDYTSIYNANKFVNEVLK